MLTAVTRGTFRLVEKATEKWVYGRNLVPLSAGASTASASQPPSPGSGTRRAPAPRKSGSYPVRSAKKEAGWEPSAFSWTEVSASGTATVACVPRRARVICSAVTA